MTKKEWDALYASDRDEHDRLYIEFMHNSDNICNCGCCPEGGKSDSLHHQCGQQICWVVVHIKAKSRG